MKDFFKNYKIPIILGTLAVIAVIVTAVLITGGFSSDSGLYILTPSGSVTITNSDISENALSGTLLKQDDIITVGPSSSCTLAYKGNKNSDDNYLIIGADTQVLVSEEFNGKDDGELFVRNGTVIGNFAGASRSSIIIRTSDSTITLKDSVSKISYYTNEFISYTDLYTFMGNSEIQLYDALRSPVNSPEFQVQKKWGRVVSEDDPSFEALNLDFDLSELTSFDLQQLIKIASIVGDDFPYTIDELKAALEAKGEDPAVTEPAVTEPIPSETSIPEAAETTPPVTYETTAPPTETTLPGNTTIHVITTTAPPAVTTVPPATQPTATQPPATSSATSTTSDTASAVTHMVTIIIDGEETIQEVPHGGNAERPADPVIEGYTFVGWDGSFENITEDTVITALFNENIIDDTNNFHIVTVVIGNNVTTLTVPHGGSADLPANIEVDGYVFRGWDKDFSNITEDVTITAILERSLTHTVTFVVEDQSFQMQVEHNGSVIPSYIPSYDSNGNRFIGWDRALDNITSDVTITAVFANDNYHIVTFVIDNEFYYVRVKDGETAEPPFWPLSDSNNNPFIGWNNDLNNITSDVTIIALYGNR